MIKIVGAKGIIEMRGSLADIMAEFSLGLRELYKQGEIDDGDLDTIVKSIKMTDEELKEKSLKKMAERLAKDVADGDEEAIKVLNALEELADLLGGLGDE